MKKNSEELKKEKKFLYVMGCTNAGKSSFINKLIKESNKYE